MATQKQLQDALRQRYERTVFIKDVLQPVFSSRLQVAAAPLDTTSLTKGEQKVIKQVQRYANIVLDDHKSVLCYEVELQDNVRIEQSKVAIQHYVRKHLTAGQAALINFVSRQHPEYWRFTLVVRDTKLGEHGVEKLDSHPKRYTYLVESGGQNRTMAERLSKLSVQSELSIDGLRTAFSVEAMSKAFFNEYKEHYQNFVEYLTGKRMVREKNKWIERKTGKSSPYLAAIFNGNEKDARDFVKKLMGRIVFLYFIQKKGWLGASSTAYNDGEHDFIFQLFKETGGDEKFFPVGLTELFFNVLNRKRSGDDWTTPAGRKVKIPYLNGGLFNRDEVDLVLASKSEMLTFPPEYFANHKDAESPDGRGFLDFLNAYNFTVYEDSLDDHTVAVDPEMLGHIFENLLEDNKDKGAYYTPKEIVHYMCQASLTEYLARHLQTNFPSLDINLVQQLVRNKEIASLEPKQMTLIGELIEKVKICDPAIGSGAFPMGLLHEIFSLKELIAYSKGEVLDSARVKESIIQNSIYGVDIERGAVDIARLRFWLSLVVDEETPRELPNLDYKIVVGNSLLSKFQDDVIEIAWDLKSNETEDLFGDTEAKKRRDLLADISKAQRSYFHPEKPADKNLLKQKIRNLKIDLLINQLELMIKAPTKEKGKKGQKGKADFDLAVEGWKEAIQTLKLIRSNDEMSFDHFDWKLDFPEILNPMLVGEQSGFDIVIGNPPYVDSEQMVKTDKIGRDLIASKYRTAKGNWDLYIPFWERSLDILNKRGSAHLITPNKWLAIDYGEKLRELTASRIVSMTDYSRYRAFENVGVFPIAILISRSASEELSISSYSDAETVSFNQKVSTSLLTKFGNWGFVLSQHLPFLLKLISTNEKLSSVCSLQSAFTVSEAYELANHLEELKPSQKDYFKFINTGTIDPYESLWGRRETTYLKKKYSKPVIDKGLFKKLFKNRFDRANSKKIVISGMRHFEAVYDEKGELLPGKSTVVAFPMEEKVSAECILGILNSNLPKFFLKECYGALAMDGGITFTNSNSGEIPVPSSFKSHEKRIKEAALKAISKKQKDPNSDISSNLAEINGLVYSLYKLTPQEISLIEGAIN